jgi:hypothetical protein
MDRDDAQRFRGDYDAGSKRFAEMAQASPVYLCLTPSAILLRPPIRVGRSSWCRSRGEGIGRSIIASFRLLAVLPARHRARVRLPQPSIRATAGERCKDFAGAIADKKIEILLLVNMPGLLVRLGENYGKTSAAEHESAAQGRVDKPNNLM